VVSIYGDDAPDEDGLSGENWSYHVAPVVAYGTSIPMELRVIDPALSNGAMTLQGWAAKMTDKNVEQISYDVMVGRLVKNPRFPRSPGGVPWMVVADPKVAFLPDERNPTVVRGTTLQEVTSALTEAALFVPQRELIASLNRLKTNFLGAEQEDPSRSSSDRPYPAFQAQLELALAFRNKLSTGELIQVRGTYPNLLHGFWKTFRESGVKSQINDLLSGILKPGAVQ
jgi:hypothetical protein